MTAKSQGKIDYNYFVVYLLKLQIGSTNKLWACFGLHHICVTVPGKRNQLGNFFKIELLLQQERVGFELQNVLHI